MRGVQLARVTTGMCMQARRHAPALPPAHAEASSQPRHLQSCHPGTAQPRRLTVSSMPATCAARAAISADASAGSTSLGLRLVVVDSTLCGVREGGREATSDQLCTELAPALVQQADPRAAGRKAGSWHLHTPQV